VALTLGSPEWARVAVSYFSLVRHKVKHGGR
jgi:hypothetical protein